MPTSVHDNARIVAGAALCLLLIAIDAPVFLSLPAGLVLALYLPGRAWLAALEETRLRWAEEQVIAIGLSLSITIVGGFVLHSVGFMTSLGWALFLSGFTLVGTVVVWLRHGGRGAFVSRVHYWPRVSFWGKCSLLASVGLVAMAYMVSYAGYHRIPGAYYTEFWMAPDLERPLGATVLGVRNREAANQTFDIELRSSAGPVARWSGIRLRPDETWRHTLPYSIKSTGSDRLEARLFKANDRNTIYRRVWLSRSRSE